MNIEILFRGKRIDNEEWIEGYYFKSNTGKSYILAYADDSGGNLTRILWNEVIPSTVGMTKKIYDDKGKPIYEQDILRLSWDGIHADGSPIQTYYFLKDILMFLNDTCGAYIEVIGNGLDNPELLDRYEL